jgi:hypothetical protein
LETLPEEPDARIGALPLVSGGQRQGDVEGDLLTLVNLGNLLILFQN